MKISVVVPIYNEQDGITHLSENLALFQATVPAGTETEFIFVDDGSADRTLSGLHDVFGNRSDCTILSHGVNRGVGAAFRTGFAQASGDIVCTIDADCTYRPERLMELIEALDRDHADIAVASPYHPKGGVVGVPRWRLVLSKGCSFLYRRRSRLKLYTYTSVFRAYRGNVVKTVRFAGNGFVSASEILIEAAKAGFNVTEVPMVLYARQVGQSKMKLARTIRTHLQLIFTGKTSGERSAAALTSQPVVKAATETNKQGVK